jgi:hypothetical protein
MSTTFKVTLTGSDKSQWFIDLGRSILDGMSDMTKDTYAEAHAVVLLQNGKLMLRACDSGECIAEALKETYPGVKVTPYEKPEPVSKMTQEKALAKVLGIDVSQITPAIMARAKALLDV